MNSAGTWLERRGLTREETLAAIVCFAFFVLLPFNGVLALKRLTLALLLLVAAHKWWRERLRPNIPVMVWAWFIFAPLSALWSVSPRFSLSESIPDALYPALATLGLCIVTTGSRLPLRTALAGMIAGTIAVALAGAAGVVKAGGIINYLWYELAHGYGQLSTLLVALLPFLMISAIQGVQEKRPALQLASLMALVALFWTAYATQVRMFWLSAMLVVAVFTIALLIRSEFAAYRKRAALVMACIMGLLLAGFIVAARAKVANYLDVPAGSGTGGAGNPIMEAFTRNERFEMWQFWLQRIAERPLLGIGFGHDLPRDTFYDIRPQHWINLMFAHAHNVFLDVAIGTGLIGLTVFIFALSAACRRFAARLREGSLAEALPAIAGIALVVGVLAKNLTDDFMSRNPLFAFWALLGLTLGAVVRQRRKGWSL